MRIMKKITIIVLILTLVIGITPVSYAADQGEQALKEALVYLTEQVKEPTVGSVGGEWIILGLLRSQTDIPGKEKYVDTYYQNALRYLKDNNGELSQIKYTEYSRLILAFTAMGKDGSNIGGYNLLEKLADFDMVKKQGVNGPIYALIALDSKGYTIPAVPGGKIQTTRQGLVDYILSRELPGGGFALSGSEIDPDITGMALQALAPYKNQPEVAKTIERSLSALSAAIGGSESSESIAQVITALTRLGIDPQTDSRFVKTDKDRNNQGLVTALLNFQMKDGSFRHLTEGSSDLMATEQAALALASYNSFLKGEGASYKYKVLLNGKYLVFDQPPVNINQRILVPMRAIFEAMGAEIQWDGTLQKVTGTLDDHEVVLVIGETKAYSNGKPVDLDSPGIIVNRRTMVPIRFIAESLEAEVGWDGKTNTVIITK